MKRIAAIFSALLIATGLSVALASSSQASTSSINVRIENGARAQIGVPYKYGGTTRAGFDCSGLTQYVYRVYAGKSIQRTAEEQFHEFHAESLSHAQPGDLVFFHDTSSPSSAVYHVGILMGGGKMIAAPGTGRRVLSESYDWGYRTYGTITH